jgi:hypothetical protein
MECLDRNKTPLSIGLEEHNSPRKHVPAANHPICLDTPSDPPPVELKACSIFPVHTATLNPSHRRVESTPHSPGPCDKPPHLPTLFQPFPAVESVRQRMRPTSRHSFFPWRPKKGSAVTWGLKRKLDGRKRVSGDNAALRYPQSYEGRL